MPLTPTAKMLMLVQSAAALVTIGLVVARAVNILSCRKPLDWGFPPGRAGDALSEQVATAARGA